MNSDLKSLHHDHGRKLLTELAQNQRRLALLKKSQLFTASLQGAQITRAVELEDLRQAFRLVHDTFVSVGYIQPIPGGLRIRPFEAAGQTANFIAKKDEQIVAVLGLVVDSPDLGLPSDSSFRQELDVLRARGLKLAEGTNQAVVPSFRKTAVTTELMRCGVAQTMMHDCDAIIVTVSPSHARFYELLDFRRASAVRSYSKTVYDPVVVMYMNTRPGPDEATTDPCLAYTRKFLFTDNPYHGNVHAWQEATDRNFRDAQLLRELFMASSDVLHACTPAQRQAIRRRWGAELFDAVAGNGHAAEQPAVGSYVPVKPSPSRPTITDPGSRTCARSPRSYRS